MERRERERAGGVEQSFYATHYGKSKHLRCCRCQLGRSTNRPACLQSVPGLSRSTVCLSVCLSVSLSCRLSLCLSICHGVTQLKLEATLVRPVDALSAIACTFWSVSVSHHQQRRFCSPVAYGWRWRRIDCVWSQQKMAQMPRIECNCRQTHPLLWGISVYSLLSKVKWLRPRIALPHCKWYSKQHKVLNIPDKNFKII